MATSRAKSLAIRGALAIAAGTFMGVMGWLAAQGMDEFVASRTARDVVVSIIAVLVVAGTCAVMVFAFRPQPVSVPLMTPPVASATSTDAAKAQGSKAAQVRPIVPLTYQRNAILQTIDHLARYGFWYRYPDEWTEALAATDRQGKEPRYEPLRYSDIQLCLDSLVNEGKLRIVHGAGGTSWEWDLPK